MDCVSRVAVLALCSLCVSIAAALTFILRCRRQFQRNKRSVCMSSASRIGFVCAINDDGTGIWWFPVVCCWRLLGELESTILFNLLCGRHGSVWAVDGAQQHPHLWQPGRGIHHRRCVSTAKSIVSHAQALGHVTDCAHSIQTQARH